MTSTSAITSTFTPHGHPLVSAVIVNYNGGDLLAQSVKAVIASSVPVEVIVVDNGSNDNSLVALDGLCQERITIIKNGANLGFTRASNLGLRKARGHFLLLLNPDCIVAPDTLCRLVEELRSYPDVGMVGCLILNEDGSEQAGCRRSVPTPWRTVVRVLHLDRIFRDRRRFQNFVLNREPVPDQPVYVEAISGALMLVRRPAFEQVGPLDEGYFLHCDDLDWCMRFQKAGWKVLFVPNVRVTHYQGTCSAGRPIFVLWHKHKGMVKFYRKFFRHQYPLPLMAFVVGAVWTRFAVLAAGVLIKRTANAMQNRDRVAGSKESLAAPKRPRIAAERRRPAIQAVYEGPERRISTDSVAAESAEMR